MFSENLVLPRIKCMMCVFFFFSCTFIMEYTLFFFSGKRVKWTKKLHRIFDSLTFYFAPIGVWELERRERRAFVICVCVFVWHWNEIQSANNCNLIRSLDCILHHHQHHHHRATETVWWAKCNFRVKICDRKNAIEKTGNRRQKKPFRRPRKRVQKRKKEEVSERQ